MWLVCNMVRTEGIVECFSARAGFDYPGALCSVVLDKRTDFYQNSLFNSQKQNETFVRTKGTFVFFNLWPNFYGKLMGFCEAKGVSHVV